MVQGAIEPGRIFQAATSREPRQLTVCRSTALAAKYPVNEYYGNGPGRSYWVGCSTDGRHFPQLSVNYA